VYKCSLKQTMQKTITLQMIRNYTITSTDL